MAHALLTNVTPSQTPTLVDLCDRLTSVWCGVVTASCVRLFRGRSLRARCSPPSTTITPRSTSSPTGPRTPPVHVRTHSNVAFSIVLIRDGVLLLAEDAAAKELAFFEPLIATRETQVQSCFVAFALEVFSKKRTFCSCRLRKQTTL